MAIDVAVRRTAVSPLPSNSAAKPLRGIRSRARPWHAASDERFVGGAAGRPATARSGTDDRKFADEVRSATRMAPAAHWASWADALPMLETRLPQVAQIVRQLDSAQAPGCLGELQRATVVLDTGGFVTRPTWSELRAGTRPTPASASEPGEWQHGWQYYASSSLEFHFRGPAWGTVARIGREAGALVQCNVKLRDMNVMVPATDEREVEVVASGLPLQHGAQLAIDVTPRNALTSFGTACTNAAGANGAVLEKARRDKEAKHGELVNGARCHLVVVAIETGNQHCSAPRSWLGGDGGPVCLQFLAAAPLLRLLSPPEQPWTAQMGSHLTWWME